MAAIRFNAEFVERRMAEHKRQQHEAEYILTQEIIQEIQAMPRRKPKTRPMLELLAPDFQRLVIDVPAGRKEDLDADVWDALIHAAKKPDSVEVRVGQ
jgi:hypothetical protein